MQQKKEITQIMLTINQTQTFKMFENKTELKKSVY